MANNNVMPNNSSGAKRGPGRPPKHQGSQQTSTQRCTNIAQTSKTSSCQSTRLDPAIRKMIDDLRSEVDALRREVESLKRSHFAPTPKQSLRATNEAASESEERARRAKNVIIRGIRPSTTVSDVDQVNSFLEAVGAGVHATKVQRIRTTTRREASVMAQGNNNSPLPAVLVVLESSEKQQQVLQYARHHQASGFSHVFAHEDRTKAQQLQFSECAKEAKANNAKLSQSGLNPPFRYVVRGDRVRCLDFVKSCDEKRSIYVTEKDIKTWLNLQKAINSGTVSDTRASIRQSTVTAANTTIAATTVATTAAAAATVATTTTAATTVATTTTASNTAATVATTAAAINETPSTSQGAQA